MINLFIITGGRGLERQVSINSANNFVKNIDTSIFEVFVVTISEYGEWFLNGALCSFIKDGSSLFCLVNGERLFVDYVFPIVHGQGAENAELQGLFQCLSFHNLIGNNLSSAAFSFDKVIAKKIAVSLGINVVPYIDYFSNPCTFRAAKELLNSEVLFLKPADNGSSFGCKKIACEQEFIFELQKIKEITSYPVIEKDMNVIECFCSVLYDEVSDVIAIDYGSNFFSYEEKYLNHLFQVKCLEDVKLASKIQQYSLLLFKAMRLNFMCRFDFFICRETGTLYFNEANSLPGLGSESLFFYSFAARYSQKQMVDKILNGWIAKSHES